MAVAIVVLAFLNLRCHVFFGAGSTTTLRFGHGWPVLFQEGSVPGPGLRDPNPNGIGPNAIWGRPEFNDDPAIMARYEAELEGMSRTPWGLRAFAEPSVLGGVVDVLAAFFILATLSLTCEVAIHSAGRQINNYYSIGAFVSVLAIFALVVGVFLGNTWCHALVALAVIAMAVLVTGVTLSRSGQ